MVMTRRVLVMAVAAAVLAAVGASALGFDQQAPVLVAGISWA
jgi:hypothetical protein